MAQPPPDIDERAEAPKPPARTAKQPTAQPRTVKIQQGLPTYQDAGPLQHQMGKPGSANRKET